MSPARSYIPLAVKERVWAKTLGLCWYCGRVIERKVRDYTAKGHLDHLIPVSRGGPDTVANLVPCCAGCNLLKGDKTLEEFRAALHESYAARIKDALAAVEDLQWFLPGQDEFAHRLRCWLAAFPRAVFYGDARQIDPSDFYCI